MLAFACAAPGTLESGELAEDEPPSVAATPDGGMDAGAHRVQDDVLGVSLSVPSAWVKRDDEFLDGEAYGFVLVEPPPAPAALAEPHATPILRVALVSDATPAQIPALVEAKTLEYPDSEVRAHDLQIGDRSAVGLTGLPAPDDGLYSLVFVGVSHRVYTLGVWRDLDEEAMELFARIQFDVPSRDVASLALPALVTFLAERGLPEAGAALLLDDERAPTITDGDELWGEEPEEALLMPIADSGESGAALARGCVQQPRGLRWQTQWIGDANFWGRRGTTTMGYPRGRGFFGQGPYHYGCWGSYHQHYAVDYPLQHGAKLYAATPGRVTYAGYRNDGYWSLGIHVDVTTYQNGNRYVSRSAHLSRVYVRKGQDISNKRLPWVVIGRAGSTGAATSSYPHLHAAVFYRPGLDRYGRAYGGTSVRPRRMRCFGCGSPDVRAPNGKGGFYTRWWHGRVLHW